MAAETAISSAVATLGDLLIQKVEFLRGVEGEVGRLRNELARMQCFLRDAAGKEAKDERVRHWVSEMREVAQDAEDAVEIFVLKVENARSRWQHARACFPKHVLYLHRIGEEIEKIRKRLQDIERSRVVYGIENLGAHRRSEDEEVESRRRLAHWQNDKQVVGLEKDVEWLHDKVILEERELGLSAATVVGMGGIGKSTLARLIYNHAAVVGRFQRRGWAVVSSEFRPREVMKELILQLLKPTEDKLRVLNIMKELELPNLREMLHERLQGTRYFIVLDDIWEDQHWLALATAFPNQDKGSRLLLTSRNKIITNYTRCVHPMRLLNHDESWKLFLKKAFIDGNDGQCEIEVLEGIGREIVKRCNGLPLVISMIGGVLLKHRQSKSEWEKALNGMKSQGSSAILDILELSYQNLPPQLRSCFLCLGCFKEDAIISAQKLVHIWIAQGLVPQEGEETMEETARGYLDELVNRNLIQVKDLNKLENEVKSCRVHDLLYELSKRKAKEEISFEGLKREGSSQSLHKPRHRVVYSGGILLEKYSNRHLRSLHIHGDGESITFGPSSYWKSFQLLRVLDLEDCALFKLPEAIGYLIGLRYLGLRNTHIKKLPSSLGRLKLLQVLDIQYCFMYSASAVWKMDSLRHLYAEAIRCSSPLKRNALKNVQTLSYILLRDSDIEQVAHMTSLRKLGIRMDEISDVCKLFASLATLENLHRLSLRNYTSPNMEGLGVLHRITQLTLGGRITELPSSFPPNLSSLSLDGTFLERDPMQVLQRMPKLLYLKMRVTYKGQEMVISGNGFPRLKVLILCLIRRLRSLHIGEGAMPELTRLEIYGCPNLSLPKEVNTMTKLEELKMVTTTEMASKLRGVDSYIISNIPSVHLVADPRLYAWRNSI